MLDMLDAYGGRLVIAILGVGLGLVLLVAVLWMMRGRGGPSPFVRGGKNRNPRLQVLDAAAVDTRRRLVLVRRDDVEHLIMIGGPTDIVIESRIAPISATPQAPAIATASAPAGIAPPAAPATEREIRQPPTIDNRPLSTRRAAVAAPAETRVDPAPEIPLEMARLSRAAPPPPAATPAPTTAVLPKPAPTPIASAAIDVPSLDPALRPAPEVRPEPMRSIGALAAANAAAHSQNETAAAVLEAARDRVLQPTPEPRVLVPANASSIPPVFQPAADNPQQLGNDFEKLLEQEMANNLAARETAAAAQASRDLPPRDPSTPKVTGATPEPTLQSEVARIFGEMSVTRDK